MKRMRTTRSPISLLGLLWLTAVLLVAVLAPLLPVAAPDAATPSLAWAAPDNDHLMGTDALGRDLFSRILWGSRISLACALAGATTALLLGVGWGLLAGGGSGRRRRGLVLRHGARRLCATPCIVCQGTVHFCQIGIWD